MLINNGVRVGGWLTLGLHNLGLKEDMAKKPISEIKIDWIKEKKSREQYKQLLLDYYVNKKLL